MLTWCIKLSLNKCQIKMRWKTGLKSTTQLGHVSVIDDWLSSFYHSESLPMLTCRTSEAPLEHWQVLINIKWRYTLPVPVVSGTSNNILYCAMVISGETQHRWSKKFRQYHESMLKRCIKLSLNKIPAWAFFTGKCRLVIHVTGLLELRQNFVLLVRWWRKWRRGQYEHGMALRVVMDRHVRW